MNQTLVAFNFPSSKLAVTNHWVVMLRPKQVTLGSLVLAIRDDLRSIGDLSPAAATELPKLVAVIEATLRRTLKADKFNYLCLMMVDPQVHFHVIPRYEGIVEYAGQVFHDDRWPGPPDLASTIDMTFDAKTRLHAELTTEISLRLNLVAWS